MAHNLKFRADIQGLRALAVIAVLIFHAGFPFLPGGFLGVDIFFVISGFLISGIILKQLESGQFSFTEFYLKRLKRLLPASVITVLLTVIASLFIFGPSDQSEAGRTGLHAILFSSNILFWLDAGYFDADSDLKPFLHFWSLSVEEQFYFVWPLIMVASFALGKRRAILASLIILSVISLISAQLLFDKHAAATFFLMPFRAFEFGAGAILAFANVKIKSDGLANAIFLAGLALMIASMAVFTEYTPMPGIFSLPPLMGCMLCLAAKDAGVGFILNNPVTTHIGNASYSIYLAHWPPVVFYHYLNTSEPTVFSQILLLATGLALGYMLYYFVEKPMRNHDLWKKGRAGFALMASAFAIAVLYVCSLLWSMQPAAAQSDRSVVVTDPAILKQEALDFRSEKDKIAMESGNPAIIVLGDSHARNFANALNFMTAKPVLIGRLDRYCQGAFDPSVENLKSGGRIITEEDFAKCRVDLGEYLKEDLVKNSDAIVIAFRWFDWSPNSLELFLTKLKAETDQPLICVGKGVEFPKNVTQLAETSSVPLVNLKTPSDRFDATNEELKAVAEANQCAFLDISKLLCENEPCPILTRDNRSLLYWDRNHITLAGAKEVGEKIASCESAGCNLIRKVTSE